jgi:hypothetical protein
MPDEHFLHFFERQHVFFPADVFQRKFLHFFEREHRDCAENQHLRKRKLFADHNDREHLRFSADLLHGRFVHLFMLALEHRRLEQLQSLQFRRE